MTENFEYPIKGKPDPKLVAAAQKKSQKLWGKIEKILKKGGTPDQSLVNGWRVLSEFDKDIDPDDYWNAKYQ